MKATGILRKIDGLGRIVIPMEIRNKLEIAENDPLEIHVEGSSIVLRKYEPDCTFCGSSRNVVEYKGKNVCEKCISELKNM
ncbi:conserved domain protein [Clostridium sp. CAG:793]|jgi:transcriptional pleiotropic regulator of transition state genes|nr:conserved domain protein [Clostridium sp. CAG:793]